jgi:hypothetical protein
LPHAVISIQGVASISKAEQGSQKARGCPGIADVQVSLYGRNSPCQAAHGYRWIHGIICERLTRDNHFLRLDIEPKLPE